MSLLSLVVLAESVELVLFSVLDFSLETLIIVLVLLVVVVKIGIVLVVVALLVKFSIKKGNVCVLSRCCLFKVKFSNLVSVIVLSLYSIFPTLVEVNKAGIRLSTGFAVFEDTLLNIKVLSDNVVVIASDESVTFTKFNFVELFNGFSVVSNNKKVEFAKK